MRAEKLQIIKRAGRCLLNLIYPRRCPVCEAVLEPGKLICKVCREKLLFIEEPVCKKCGKPLDSETAEYCYDCGKKQHSYEAGKAVFLYHGGIRDSLYRYKYSNKREYACFYAAETVRQYGSWIKDRGVDAVVPIPLHKIRQHRRGYNQAELYARMLGEMLELPVFPKALIRVENTRPQKELNDAERKNNLKKAFKCRESIVQSKCILLVDDIYTTGSTIDAAAKELKNAGVEKVFFICVSIGRGL